MKRNYFFLITFVLLMCTSPAICQNHIVLAVLNFQNNSGDTELNYLEEAIPEMLITNLAVSRQIKIVERTRIRDILEEQKLSLSGAVDEETATTIGKLLGANHLLYGGIFSSNDKLRIDARVSNTADGSIVIAEKMETAVDTDLIETLDQLSLKLIKGLTDEQFTVDYEEDAPVFDPIGNEPVAVTCAMDNTHRLMKSDAPNYLLINLKAGKVETNRTRVPLNISLVLDKSGSMGSENKLENARQAALFVVDNLSSSDYFSLVTYDTHVYNPIPAAPVKDKEILKAKIREIECGSSTNLSGGMMEGYSQIERNFQNGYVNRELLLTDGLANTGITNPHQLKNIATEKNRKGFTISTFGVGFSFNEDLLTTLAEFGGANYYYIDSAERIAEIFANELQGLLSVVVQNASINIELADGIELIDVFGYSFEQSGKTVSIKLNDIFSEEIKTVLLKLDLNASSKSEINIGKVRLQYDDVVLENKRIVKTFEPKIKQTSDPKLVQNGKNAFVHENITLFESARMMDEAITLIDNRNFDQAKKVMDQNFNYLQSNVSLTSSRRVKQQILNAMKYSDEYKNAEQMDAAEMEMMQKSVKYKNYLQKKKK
ncbi:VWA domain-containing protein [candidate division KSB1 bacterium]|nr:VWA domain-containing protein [candidate division KSB1 bacterium]